MLDLETIQTLLPKSEEAAAKYLEPETPQMNPNFFVGPIMRPNTANPVQQEQWEAKYQNWIRANYNTPLAGLEQRSHRSPAGNKAVLDYMKNVHDFLQLPKDVTLTFGEAGGHGGFDMATQAILQPGSEGYIYVDTQDPRKAEVEVGQQGHFRRMWAQQILDLYKGNEHKVVFAEPSEEGTVPKKITEDGRINYIIAVANETTAGKALDTKSINNLRTWTKDPSHHAILDITSLLGAKTLDPDLLSRVNFFTPLQKALGGVAGYCVVGLCPQTRAHIEKTPEGVHSSLANRFWKREPEGKRTICKATYNAEYDTMSPVINSFWVEAITKSHYALLQLRQHLESTRRADEQGLSPIEQLTKRSTENNIFLQDWAERSPFFSMTVAAAAVDEQSIQSPAVTLLSITDPDLAGHDDVQEEIAKRVRDKLAEKGIAYDTNPYPGTPGAIRFWSNGVRPAEDLVALTTWLDHQYAISKHEYLQEQAAVLSGASKHSNPPVEVKAEAAQAQSIISPEQLKAAQLYLATLCAIACTSNAAAQTNLIKVYGEDLGEYWRTCAPALEAANSVILGAA